MMYKNKKCNDKIKNEGKYIISKEKLEKIKKDFLSARMSEKEILNVIKEVYENKRSYIGST